MMSCSPPGIIVRSVSRKSNKKGSAKGDKMSRAPPWLLLNGLILGDAMTLVLWLRDLDSKAVERAGGKAANLGELCRAGLPVPPGFLLTTDAYEHFVTANALQPEIHR